MQLSSRAGMPKTSRTETRQILDALSALTRELTRAAGGPDDGPPMTSTQRLALFETAVGGPLRLSELADRIGITAPTASRAVDGLVELGLLERVPDPEDRRAVHIDLTPPGRKRVEERKAAAAAALDTLVAELPTKDRVQLAALLTRLADRIH
jgi:DNA-binding MarR family transcriptional regulator